MSAGWKSEVLPGASDEGLPEGYERRNGVIGRGELIGGTDEGVWAESEFVGRANTPHTTSAIEQRARRRALKRIASELEVDPAQPVLDLGCADGTFAHELLDLGFERILSMDILAEPVAALDRALDNGQRDRTLLVVDDMLRIPLAPESFATVIAWGVVSLTEDPARALGLTWSWVKPGGLLLLAEPTLEQALVYPLVRGDLEEFRRVRAERTRASMWDDRDNRYPVSPAHEHRAALEALPGAEIVDSGGIGMLPSLVLGGVVQDSPIGESELDGLSELLDDPELDRMDLSRQAYWLARKG